MNSKKTSLPNLMIGTASWGSKVSKQEAFKIIEKSLENDYFVFDSATNYPINGNPQSWNMALRYLHEWITTNPNSLIKIFIKMGAVRNDGSSQNNLSTEFLKSQMDFWNQKLGKNVLGFGIHWDDRSAEHKTDVENMIEALLSTDLKNQYFGISGIKCPQNYTNNIGIDFSNWIIQVKNNSTEQVSINNYLPHFSSNPYFAYGISARIKNRNFETKEKKNLAYESELIHIKENLNYFGCIIGPSSSEQLLQTLRLWKTK